MFLTFDQPNYFKKMLQRLMFTSLKVKFTSRNKNLLCRLPLQSVSCHQCGFRLYSSQKVSVLQNSFERTFNRRGLFGVTVRYHSSQVDAQNKNDKVESLKSDVSHSTSKKINVKLKTSELKRLLGLAEPEKWKLTGKLLVQMYRLLHNLELNPSYD